MAISDTRTSRTPIRPGAFYLDLITTQRWLREAETRSLSDWVLSHLKESQWTRCHRPLLQLCRNRLSFRQKCRLVTHTAFRASASAYRRERTCQQSQTFEIVHAVMLTLFSRCIGTTSPCLWIR